MYGMEYAIYRQQCLGNAAVHHKATDLSNMGNTRLPSDPEDVIAIYIHFPDSRLVTRVGHTANENNSASELCKSNHYVTTAKWTR